MKLPLAAMFPLLVVLIWVVALNAEAGPFVASHSLFLIGFGLILCATVSVVGMLVVGGRWAYRLAWAVLAATGALAVFRPVDGWWTAGLVATALGGVGLVSVAPTIRKRPAAIGPGQRAVLVPLLLISVPVVVGMSVPGPTWAAVVVGVSAPIAAFLYARVVLGGLLAVRIVWPALGIAIAPLADTPGQFVIAGLVLVVAALAWHPSVKVAFHPPREVGSTFPIPPELTPQEVLDAARIDDTGKPSE